ncbi:hypothetical protein BHU72_07215 [Desulfuribacillus stibiiarsenatis]|uniref:Uncharacterized protein n=1 Tax=Desulfuribacillus stibiiarsenatis TaxID=1390249 RepID=A0A1E5L4I7_9FIRM|nr:hypothetical protein [Desulfuribacillus stibiiarsenatis]OEH84973.1 hypothetical protein BHU72_07215 [Desulfuribacillus stibiiarsenatis]
MQILRWVIGLFQTIFIHFLLGLAIAMLMVKWTWLDMRSNAGAMIFALLIISTCVYLLNSKVRLYRKLYWQRPLIGSLLIGFSGIIIVATNSFTIDHMLIVPAYTVRAGFFLKNVSLAQVNMTMLIILIVGLISHILLHANRWGLLKGLSLQSKEEHPIRETSRKRKMQILGVMYPVFIFLTLYLVQPGIRYFINQYVCH